MAWSFSIEVMPKSPEQVKLSELNIMATQQGKDGHLDDAVFTLYQVKDLMQKTSGHAFKSWLRLPMYLQKAGRFDEAMKEFQWLLDTIQERIDRELVIDPEHNRITKGVKQYIKHGELSDIYASMSLACKREKRQPDAERYTEKSALHKARWKEIKEIEDERKRVALAKRMKEREERRAKRSIP